MGDGVSRQGDGARHYRGDLRPRDGWHQARSHWADGNPQSARIPSTTPPGRRSASGAPTARPFRSRVPPRGRGGRFPAARHSSLVRTSSPHAATTRRRATRSDWSISAISAAAARPSRRGFRAANPRRRSPRLRKSSAGSPRSASPPEAPTAASACKPRLRCATINARPASYRPTAMPASACWPACAKACEWARDRVGCDQPFQPRT